MEIHKHQLNWIFFYRYSQPPLSFCAVTLTLIKQDDQILECRLIFQVNPEIYQQINKENLFNLKQEVRSPFSGGKFLSDIDINIEVTLKPDLLPQLLEKANNAEEAANYILTLSQQQSENTEIHPLLNTESWLCLSVKQNQPSGEVGYNTFWYYVNPSTINNPNTSSEQVSEGIVNFVKEWTEANLSAATQDFTNEMLNGIGNVFKDFANEIFLETDKDSIPNQTIFEAIVNFFTEDDWPFVQIEDNSALSLAFRGDNGKWNCYAKAREIEQQFAFYSIFPFNVPENKRQAIAEFIARANYNMIIGNFELDFYDGEIRYKTSIDVEGDNLSFALIKNLVYANVSVMDKYLPGIMSIIHSDAIPELAIDQVEQNQETSQILGESEQVSNVLPVDEQEELASKPSSQMEVKPQEIILNRKPHILTILTPEEIGQFHQALQVMPHYQRKQAEAILEKVKQGIITRLGESGEGIFTQGYNFFSQVKIEIKNLKLIQRYSGIAERINLFLPNLNNEHEDYRKLLVQGVNPIDELSDIFWNTDYRLRGLPTDKLEGRKEVELLIEIEEFRSRLAEFDRLFEK
ncbi:MAG TPA: YbjN domain-containing protein [Nostocaceae cyanobacterium]|nr:YbjN domain-containing protein [Nostocaceae cyanobacterium]